MKISIVTAVFNRVQTIGQALETVSQQTYDAIDHVIQDGGSTDGTLEILEKKSNRNIRIKSAPDAGIYDAINKGITRAEGEVIGLMHSDDFFADDQVLADVAELFEDPDVDGVYGDLQYVAAEDTTRVIRHWRSGPYDPRKLQHGWMPPHPTVYLRRKVFEEFGLYDTSYRIAADYDAMLRYMGKGGIRMAYLPRVMVKMRVGGESNRSLKHIILKSREDYRALRSNGMGGAGALVRKNLSKIGQFVNKD
ncbi:PGL/p-HBAD biosynthesis glycosyltransferase/MT3031 [Marinovum algicola]|uniref:Glycosyltransferase n=1 Tax=Marinovum algicola TaxID=42444 RepID=A0A975ZR43_9RHOB|nr:glycosyltransferase family 2 protein [Marinovum algicola]SEK11279.1 glycosyltransferase [Marinovum algicola]SLN76453.1 PGL/p-HBAD biosynthesis glycosyltransferase/MT3031 [Marinovum algicola]